MIKLTEVKVDAKASMAMLEIPQDGNLHFDALIRTREAGGKKILDNIFRYLDSQHSL